MARITLDCPHCLEKRMGFDISAYNELLRAPMPGAHSLYAISLVCLNQNCRNFVSARIGGNQRFRDIITDRNPHSANTSVTECVEVIQIWPEPPKPDIPRFLPEEVASLLEEAENVRIAGNFRSARMTYRSALDVATKSLVASARKKKLRLIDRIDYLAQQRKITPALQEWAHAVRVIANESAHTAEQVSREEAEEIAEITRMLFVYLFEMPKRVERARTDAKHVPLSGKALLAPPVQDYRTASET